MSVKKTISLDNIFIFREPKKEFKEDSMRFLYKMSIFMSLERIENGLDDLFMFKEPEKK